MPICPVCDEHNGDKNMFCINCGEELIHMDFVKTPGTPPRKRSPRMAPSIRAVAPVSVAGPQPAPINQPPVPTDPAPFPGMPIAPIPTEPAPPYNNTAPEDPAPFPESFPPGPNDGASPFPTDEVAAPIPNMPVSNAPVPNNIPSNNAADPFADIENEPPFPDGPETPFPENTATPDGIQDDPFSDPAPEISGPTGGFPGDAPADAFPEDVSTMDTPQVAATSDANPFPDDGDSNPEPGVPFPDDGIVSSPQNEPADETAVPFPDDDSSLSDTPFPDDEAPSSAQDATDFPFPDEDHPGQDDAPPFPDDDPDQRVSEHDDATFPNVPAEETSPFPDDGAGMPFPDDVHRTSDSGEVPFPDDASSPEATDAAPFPDSDTPPPSANADADPVGIPFPVDTPAESVPFPSEAPEDVTDMISPFDEPSVDATADTLENSAMSQPRGASPASPGSSAAPRRAATPFQGEPQAPKAAPTQDKRPGRPATGTQIHQAVSVSVPAPPASASLPDLDQIADGSAPVRPQTSDALPRPKAPLTTVPAPVQWHSECEMCGFHNEPDAVYCGECGTAIKKKEFSESAIVQRAKLVQVSFDGGETHVFDIDNQGLVINAETGDIAPLNQYHPNLHAIFRVAGADIQLTPPKGEHGVFVRIPPKKPTEINTGNVVRVGHQTLLFEGGTHQYNAWGTLTAKPPSPTEKVIPLDAEDMIIGREAGHIQFPDDFLVSGTHMRIYTANGRYLIYDLASTNGTYLQVTTPYHPVPGEVFIIATKIYKTSIE